MDAALSAIKCQVLVYLDDIVVLFLSATKRTNHVKHAEKLLRNAGGTFNSNEWHVFSKTPDYGVTLFT